MIYHPALCIVMQLTIASMNNFGWFTCEHLTFVSQNPFHLDICLSWYSRITRSLRVFDFDHKRFEQPVLSQTKKW